MSFKCLLCIILFNLIYYITSKKSYHYNAHFIDFKTDFNVVILILRTGGRLASDTNQRNSLKPFLFHSSLGLSSNKWDRLIKLWSQKSSNPSTFICPMTQPTLSSGTHQEKCACPPKDIYKNVHSHLYHNRCKLETILIFH